MTGHASETPGNPQAEIRPLGCFLLLKQQKRRKNVLRGVMSFNGFTNVISTLKCKQPPCNKKKKMTVLFLNLPHQLDLYSWSGSPHQISQLSPSLLSVAGGNCAECSGDAHTSPP